MKSIVAIGGAVIKTAKEEMRRVIENGQVEILIHNGASLFHDFQLATDKDLQEMKMHSYPLEALLENKDLDRQAAEMVWRWIRGGRAPWGSITHLCEDMEIPVLCFSGMGTDFWQLFDEKWEDFAKKSILDLYYLAARMQLGPFHFLLMGSAVIHPEIFRSALALARPKHFTADVVDFIDQYRPRTRVACYGKYYLMEFKDFLRKWEEKNVSDQMQIRP